MVSSALFGITLSMIGFSAPSHGMEPAAIVTGATDPAGSGAATTNAVVEPFVPTVVIKGKRPRRRIDRERYDLDKDLGFQGSTVAEALRRVPSVAVDANGKIYLRGRTNVQVYIDGHPSILTGGDSRGLVLNAMPSNWVSAIEVITIPNASMAMGNGDAIINLVTNKDHKPGGFGSGELTTNGSDRTGLNLAGSYGNSRLTISGGLNIRQDAQATSNSSTIETFDGAHSPLSLSQVLSDYRLLNRSGSVRGGVTYTPNALNSLSAQLELTHATSSSDGQIQSSVGEGEPGLGERYDQTSRQSDDTLGRSLDLSWTYSDLDKGETLRLNLNVSRNVSQARSRDQFAYRMPIVRQSEAQRRSDNRTSMTVVSLDYERPLGEGQVTTGLNYNQTRLGATSLATGEGQIDNDLLSNQSRDRQAISAIYGTYQRPFGERWSVQAGLRAEAYQVGSNQGGRDLKDTYTQWTPSIFVLYQTETGAKWRLAYSREQQSASLQARNPNLVYQDAQTFTEGNPNLKAQTTDNFELNYDTFSDRGDAQVKFFYAPTRGVVVPMTRVLTDGVIVRGQDNGGTGYSLGMEVNVGRRLTKKLNLQLNLGVAQNSRQIQANEREQATALSGQAILNYNPSDKDTFALIYTVQGSGLTGQGTSKPFSFSSLNYSHTFSPKLALTLDVQNPFGKGSTRQRSETPTLITNSESRSDNRVIMLTLRRSFTHFER